MVSFVLKTIITSFLAVLVIIALIFSYKSQKVKSSKLLVVNVLDDTLYSDCHIVNSLHVPFENVEDFIVNLARDTEVVFYCSNCQCTASGYAARKAREAGIGNAWAYEAGIAEWYQKGYPVNGPCKQSYLNKKIEEPEKSLAQDFDMTTEELARKMQVESEKKAR